MPESEDENAVESADQGDVGPGLRYWTIIAESAGGGDLRGCHIIEVAKGEYDFTDPDFNVLSKSIIFPPIFEHIERKKDKWTVEVHPGLHEFSEFIIGKWSKQDSPDTGGSGEWTAQSGIGPLGEKAAAADAS